MAIRSLWMLTIFSLVAAAQAPPQDVNGVLLERDSTASGQLILRAADSQVFRFQYDAHTQVDRDHQFLDVPHLRFGDKIEVTSEAVSGSLIRYAKSVRVVVPVLLTPPSRTTHVTPALDRLLTTASLTFAGVVTEFTPQRLVLHTRDGDRTLRLRQDTRYIADGGAVEAAALRPNMRVFVQAGKDLYERLEAYRIIWGTIFDPGK